jgi:hypothetical protein
MRYNWCSPAHNWCLAEVIPAGAKTTVQIWRGLSDRAQSQKYALALGSESRHSAEDDANVLVELAFRLAMGHFGQSLQLEVDVVRLEDDGTVAPWLAELPDPLA